MRAVTGVVAVMLLTAVSAPAQVSERPPCEIAQDQTYGLTPEQAIQVGGSPLYGASRQRRYLDTLRGPEGQAITYKRVGQHRAADGTILDRYDVTYAGLEKPITLFLDWYHFNPLKAPRGFTCGQPFDIGAPPLDPFRESDHLQKVALLQGATKAFAPIPLSPDGSTKHGVILDQFRVLANASRAAAAQGAPLDPAKLPVDVARAGMLLILVPLECDGKRVPPRSVAMSDGSGRFMSDAIRDVSADRVAKVLPGVTVPAGALVAEAQLRRPRHGDTFQVTYAEVACGLTSETLTFRTTFTPAKGIVMPPALLPEGADPGPAMLLQVLVDTEGKIQQPDYIGGSPALLATATESLNAWQVEPARANGAPVASGVVLQVQFATKK